MERIQIKTISTVDAVSDMLENDIYSLRYSMGEKITEADLVSRYNVSRNTIRESFAYLISMGLLEKVANKGIYVKDISANDIEEIFHLRELLEAEAIREVIAQKANLSKLRTLADAVASSSTPSGFNENRKADIAFHQALVEAAGSPRLMKMYEGLLFEVKLCVYQAQAFVPARPENAILHFKLLNAIEEGNLEQSLQYLSEHIDSAIKSYQTGLQNRQHQH